MNNDTAEREAIAALIVAGKNLRQHWLDTDAYKEMDGFSMVMRAKEMRQRDAETKRDFLDALKQAEKGKQHA